MLPDYVKTSSENAAGYYYKSLQRGIHGEYKFGKVGKNQDILSGFTI